VAVLHHRLPGYVIQLSLGDIASLRRVLPKGCYPFLSGRSERIFRLFLASLSASATGVIATPNRSVVTLDQSVTTLFAVPSLVSKTVTFATGRVIPKRNFLVKVSGVLFFEKRSVFLFARETLSVLADNSWKKHFSSLREMSLCGCAERGSTNLSEITCRNLACRVKCDFLDRLCSSAV
jgi:hypothetical protein